MWNCGQERCPVVILLNSDFHVNLGIFYMPQIYDMGPTALLPLRRKACWGFFGPKNPTALTGFEPANLGTKGQHGTPRPPKPKHNNIRWKIKTHTFTYLQRKCQRLQNSNSEVYVRKCYQAWKWITVKFKGKGCELQQLRPLSRH